MKQGGNRMFNFLKGVKKQPVNKDAIKADEVLTPEMQNAPATNEEIETTLSIPENWNMSDEEQYVFAFHNSQSPKLKLNQISIYGMELTKDNDDSVLITGLIRSTVTQSIQFGETAILLLGANKQPIARKTFDLSLLGDIPTNSARPWNFVFKKEDFITEIDEIGDEWSLAFELKSQHQLDLEESWEKSIDEKTKNVLEKLVADAPPLKPNEVNFLGVNAKQKKNGDLVVTILIRNGNEKNITLEQIPLGIKDASNEEIARGSFTLDKLTVKANTSKPWSFIFPKSMIVKEELDLSRWQAYPIQ